MAITSLSPGEHWSDVVRDALGSMEERKSKLDALRAHLIERATQAQNGGFVV